MIYHFRPYSVDKQFADAINTHCNLVPNQDDWIVITDGDMMFLTPDWGVIIDKAIKDHGNEYDLLGCWVNRVNPTSKQILVNDAYDDLTIMPHYELARFQSECSNIIRKIDKIGGFFMCFKKATWDKVGGFKQNTKWFDIDFCNSITNSGGKIGLINQLYVFHLYRPWAKNPATDSRHLNP
jgi:GT2 family glycosyltransferase